MEASGFGSVKDKDTLDKLKELAGEVVDDIYDDVVDRIKILKNDNATIIIVEKEKGGNGIILKILPDGSVEGHATAADKIKEMESILALVNSQYCTYLLCRVNAFLIAG